MIGKSISHYKIIEKLGSGGMGEVFLAEDTRLNRRVALKFLPSQLVSDEEFKARFTREAQAAAKLNHPNIITIHEVSDHDGRPYFVMEYIEGGSLREIMKSRDLSTDQTIDIIVQICEGLRAAHDAGIVHRDIKPSNILIDRDGRCRILDFGLAAVQTEEKLTKSGSSLGTVNYMSPEQVQGEDVDHRSDIFSLGVVFYEMITAQLPFPGDYDAAVGYSILNESPLPLERYRPDVTEELQRIIDLSMEKDKETRYQDLIELISDLKALKSSADKKGRLTEESVSSTADAKISIAVLYFEDFTGDENIRWLSRGLPHMLITDLEQSSQLNVVSYQRLFDILRLFGKEDTESINIKTATAIAKRAKASRILAGSIFKSGENIRIDYQLQEVNSGTLLGAGKVLGNDPLTLADQLGADVRQKLDIKLLPNQARKIADVTTGSPEAYKYYLEGVNYSERYQLEKAEECYNRALKYDPTFAMVYFRLAHISTGTEKKKMINLAIKYSGKANQKDRHYIYFLNSLMNGKPRVALNHLKQIVKYYPDEKEAYFWIGAIYSNDLYNPKASLKYYKKSLEIDPNYEYTHNQLAYVYNRLGNFEKALEAIQKCISIKPDEAYSFDTLGDIYAFNGHVSEAIDAYKKALELRTEYQSLRKLGYVYLLLGEYSEAEIHFKQLCACRDKEYRSEGRTCLALIHVARGQFLRALEILKEGEIADKLENVESRGKVMKHLLRALIFESQGSLISAVNEIEGNAGIWEWVYVVAWPWDYLRILAKMGDFEKARTTVDSLMVNGGQKDSSLTEVLKSYSGCIEYYRNNYPAAIEYLKSSLRYTIDLGGYGYFPKQYILAMAYLDAERYDECIELLMRMLSFYSVGRAFYSIWSVKMNYYLGIAYEKSSRFKEAIERYEEFLETWKDADPGIEEVDDAKTRLARLKNEI